MLDLARDIIGSQPILTAFLAIGVGYLVGQINIFGFSLGVGAVLFVGLAIGAFAPKAQIIGPIGLTGLIMFLYGIGILYGRQFFEGMVGAGQKYNLLALVGCLAGLAVALLLGHIFGIKVGHTLGMYAGSMTSTATLQAALEVMKNKDPSIGYSIAYPFGVIGPILCIYFMTQIVKPKFPAKTQRFHMGEISVGERFAGRRLGDLMAKAPAGLQVTMVRKGGHNIVPTDDTILENGDAVLVVAEDKEAIATAAAKLGKLSPGQLASDRADLDYIRVFVGKASAVGIPLAQLPMPAGYPTHLLHVRRYDADLVPAPDLMLEFGDRVGVLAPPDRKEEIRRHFGDTVKATAEFSYVSLGLGMVMGVLLGLIPIPIPGVGIVTLGIGGGPLIVALILGKLRRTGPMLWTMPLPANIVLRNFGLAMFLATVGVNAGQPFVKTVAESGFTMLFIGVAVLLTTVFIVLLVGHYLMKIPYDDLVGIASGATGNPAILVYSTKMAPTERPDIGYAMIFPSMTLVKVIAAQIVGLLMVRQRRLGDGCGFPAVMRRPSQKPAQARGDTAWLTGIPAATTHLQFECVQPGRDQGGCRESRSQEGEPSLSGFVHAGGDRRGQHRARRALLYRHRQRRGVELRHRARDGRGGVFARAGNRSGWWRRTLHGKQSDRDGLGERKVYDRRNAAQLGHRLFRQPDRRARACGPGLPFASSRHEWRPRRPVDTEDGRHQDPARRRHAILQGQCCVTCWFAWRYGLRMPAVR